VYLLLSKVHLTDLLKDSTLHSDSDCPTISGILNHSDLIVFYLHSKTFESTAKMLPAIAVIYMYA
jgi:hypothetical protein